MARASKSRDRAPVESPVEGMSHRVIYSPRAETQLVKLHGGHCREIVAGDRGRYTAAIVKYCLAFSIFPNRGTRRADIRAGLRTVGYRRQTGLFLRPAIVTGSSRGI